MKTITAHASFEENIKRSRFIAHAAPVSSERETLEFYESVADPAATHNCWAWRLDLKYRFNDDGEPSGTAGRPMLSMLEGRDLDRIMVVVTRYYGGIKLGVGGLVRAYSGTAAKCIDRANLKEIVHYTVCQVTAGFDHTSAVHQLLDRHPVRKLSEDFDENGLQLRLEVPRGLVTELGVELENHSRGGAVLKPVRS